jgi:ParB family chromosome partitioning protein
MASSLEVGGDVVEDVGVRLAVDPRCCWQPDDTFFDLIRDRISLNGMLEEVAGEAVAKANVVEKAKTQKQVIRDCLTGSNGRAKVEGWLPGWMVFPAYGLGVRNAPAPDAEDEPVAVAAE